jgi:hypothetical protein
MFSRLFPQRYPQAKQTPEAAEAARRARDAWTTLLGRVSELEQAYRRLDEAHSTTVSQLHKLRGQVHGHRARPESEEVPFGDKEALRRRAGISHGQRFVHQPDQE